MKSFALFYLAAAALSCLSIEHTNAYTLELVEKFNKLCVDEYTTKMQYDQNLGLESSESLYEQYQKIMDERITLGSALHIYFCPKQLIGHLWANEGTRSEQLGNIELGYDEMCRSEARTAMLCSMVKQERAAKGFKVDDSLFAKGLKYCRQHELARAARLKYKHKFGISLLCNESVEHEARQQAKEEVEQFKLGNFDAAGGVASDVQLSMEIERGYLEKCRFEVKMVAFCSRIKEARQLARTLIAKQGEAEVDEDENTLLKEEQFHCGKLEEARKARISYKYDFEISHNCVGPEVDEAKSEAEKEAAESISLPSIKLVDEKHKSFGGKICNILGGCFNPSKKVQE